MNCDNKRKLSMTAKCRQGLSLIELLIALALISLVLIVGYLLYFHAIHSFNTGEARQNLQQNVRHAANFITTELRFASEVTILGPEDPIDEVDGSRYIFISDGFIYLSDESGSLSPVQGVIVDGTTFVEDSLTFNGVGENMLSFAIKAAKDNQVYHLESEVQPLNLSQPIAGVNGGVAIRYRR